MGLKELENITVISDAPLKLRLKIPELDIMISGERAEKLLALRHFLLPYISSERQESDSDIKSLLRFWGIGIKDAVILSKLLKTDVTRINELIEEAKSKAFIDQNGNISPTGNNIFSDEERKLMEG